MCFIFFFVNTDDNRKITNERRKLGILTILKYTFYNFRKTIS